MFAFLTAVQAIVALLLVVVILMQKSEGGGLGVGGSPSGMLSARGAADFLTRSTGVLATIFVVLSIILAAMAVNETGGREIDTSLQRDATPVTPVQPVDPLAGGAAPVQGAASDAAVDPLSGSPAQ